MFDVSGQQIKKGIKGYIYGERGVWRPGDSLFLSFILEDKENLLPEEQPVISNYLDLTINLDNEKLEHMVKWVL